jgi:Zn-dependent protease
MLFFGTDPPRIIAFVITAILAFAYHEFAHAIVADRLGDPTPRSYGRISLNPIVHLDLFGIIMLLVAGFGWASTPVSPGRLRGNPRTSMAIVSVAGPAANLLMALLFALPLRLGVVEPSAASGILPSLSMLLQVGVQINLLLMVFNLLPIPPLDGFTILVGLLPPEMAYQIEPLRQYGTLILIAVIFFLPRLGVDIFGLVLSPVFRLLYPLLTGVRVF